MENWRNASKISLLTLLGIMFFLVQGCATARVPLSYSPTSVRTAQGSLTVTGFKYLPAETGKVQAYQIRNTAMGDVMCDQDINSFFRDAVFKELRFVGVKVDDKTRTLGGEIIEFLIDDLGFNVDWTLQVRYVLTNTEKGTVMYEGIKTTKKRTAKFANVFGALNETIRVNVDELLTDEAFSNSIK